MPQAPLNRPSNNVALLPVILMVAALVLRVLSQHGVVPSSLANLSPLMAFAFAGAVVFPRSLPWWSWAIVLLVLDWTSTGSEWWRQANGRPEVLLSYGCYALAAFWGGSLRGRTSVLTTLFGTLACSIGFYVVTNTMSWLTDASYAKNLAGWVQALTVGTAGTSAGASYPTTLEFFRNSLIADLIGASALLVLYNGEAIVRKLRTIPWIGFGSRSALTA